MVFLINDTIAFKSDSVLVSLSQVWDKVPVRKNNKLVVKSFDKKGKYIGDAGHRTFEKKPIFEGPYIQNTLSL